MADKPDSVKLSGAEFAEMLRLLAKYGDEMDQFDHIQLVTPRGSIVYFELSMAPHPECDPDVVYRKVPDGR